MLTLRSTFSPSTKIFVAYFISFKPIFVYIHCSLLKYEREIPDILCHFCRIKNHCWKKPNKAASLCNLGRFIPDWGTSKRIVIFSHYHENLINLTDFSYSTYHIVTYQKMADFISINILCNTTGGKTSHSPKPVWEECINHNRIIVVSVLWYLIHKNVYFVAVRRKYRRWYSSHLHEFC